MQAYPVTCFIVPTHLTGKLASKMCKASYLVHHDGLHCTCSKDIDNWLRHYVFHYIAQHNGSNQLTVMFHFYLKSHTACCSSWWQQKIKYAQQMCLAWFVHVQCLCNWCLKATFIECLSVLEALFLDTKCKHSGSTCSRLPCTTYCRRMHGFNDAIENHASAWSNMWPTSIYLRLHLKYSILS